MPFFFTSKEFESSHISRRVLDFGRSEPGPRAMGAEEGGIARDAARPFPVDDTHALAEELESLGGAQDVAVGVASVYCSVCPAASRAAALSRTAVRPRCEVVRAVNELPNGSASRFVLEVDDPDETRVGAGTDGNCVERNDGTSASSSDAVSSASRGDAPSAGADRRTRRYRVDGIAPSGGIPSAMWRDVADWLHRGFDAVVVAHGQSGSGKTRALFGDGGGVHERDRPGLVSRVVRALFARERNEERRDRPSGANAKSVTRFSVSAWELSPSGDALDLLDPAGEGKGFAASGGGSFAGAGVRFGGDRLARVRRVEVRDAEECEAALTFARRASKNWTVPARRHGRPPAEGFAGAAATPRPGRAHAFFRLTAFSASDGVVAELHVVDLIGAESLAESLDAASSGVGDGDGDDARSRAARRDDRCDVARQLLAFGRVVDELASRTRRRVVDETSPSFGASSDGDDDVSVSAIDGRPSTTGSAIAVAARESRLTRILAPLLAAGARLFFLACVSPLDADRLDTLETMRVARRAARLRSACVRRRVAASEHARGLDACPGRMESLRDVLAERARVDVRRDAAKGGGTDRRGASPSGVLSPNRPARLPAALTTRRVASSASRRDPRAREEARDEADSPSRRLAVGAYLRLRECPTPDAPASNSPRDFESDAHASFAARELAADEAESSATRELGLAPNSTERRLVAETTPLETTPDGSPAETASAGASGDAAGDPAPQPRSRDLSLPEPARADARLASLRARFSDLFVSVTAGASAETSGRAPAADGDAPAADAFGEYFAVGGVERRASDGDDGTGDDGKPSERPSERPFERPFERLFEPCDATSTAHLGERELRRRLDALAATLGAERRARVACEEKLSAAKLDCETRVLEARAAQDSARLEVTELRRRHDLLLERTPEAFGELFSRYERDVAAAERECARLRRENLDLTVEFAGRLEDEGADRAATADRPDPDPDPRISASARADAPPRVSAGEAMSPETGVATALASRNAQKRLDRLCAALRKSEDARARAEAENAELRRRERVTATRARAFDDAARRLRVLEAQNRECTEAMREANLAVARANALRHESEERAREAREEAADLREEADRAAAEAHRANARCHELEASDLEKRAAVSGTTLLARHAALASARAALDVPDQPSLLKTAAELRAAATRAAGTPGNASALARLFDAFVEDIERGFEASKRARDDERGTEDDPTCARTKTSNGGSPPKARKRPDVFAPAEDAFASDAASGSGGGSASVAPLGASRVQNRLEATSPSATGLVPSERDERRRRPRGARAGGADARDARDARDSDPAPEPVSGFGTRNGSSSARSAADLSLPKRKVTAVSKKLTLRAPPPDIAAAAAAAARRAHVPRAPFATDETFDFPPRRRGGGGGADASAVPASPAPPASRDASPEGPRFLAPLTARRERQEGDGRRDENAAASPDASPRAARKRRASESETFSFSPPEARATSFVGGLTRFHVGRSPSPKRRGDRETRGRESPSSLVRSSPGSPRAFFPAGRHSVRERGSP